MDLYELVDQVAALVQQRGRVTYRSLKRQFSLTDDYFADLKAEILYAHPEVVDDEGRGFMWKGDGASPSPLNDISPQSQPPASYTPPHLAERIRVEQAAMEARGSTDGERKTITALFADLKGSTALIEGLDPEEARAFIDPALQLMMDAVHRYEGYVAQALGDGIFALFGAPIAHEDHPQRALYAALRMQDEMRRYSDQSRLKGGLPLQMRVGINTGEVIVRSIRKDDLHTDYVPVGHSTNLAARMEQMATPGSILVTAYTHKLTEGYFELKGLGEAQIKGVEEPLKVYEVLGAGPLRTRLQVSATRGLTRFVGRQSEMEQLKRALAQAQASHGQIVGVMGEPGLGKSRLFYEFKLTSPGECLVLEAYSVSHGKASPYLPVTELLKSYFQIHPQDDERARREKVGGKVLMLDRSLEETLPYLFFLLGIDDATSPLQQMDPQIRRRRTFEAMKKLLLRESLNQPLLLIFEDLHWIDSETQGFLDTLSEGVASARILLLVNYRPEYRQEWGQKTYYTQLRLAPLGKEEAEEFLTFLVGQDASVKGLKQLILEKTEGTPFFMEEIVQELVEQGVLVRDAGGARCNVPLPTDLHIPTTVQGVLAARIDRLAPEEKELLQQLAVIGREFPLSLIRRVITQSEEELYRQDPGVTGLCMLANTLWLLGYPDQALRRMQEALTLAQEIAHPYSLTFALGSSAWVGTYRREEAHAVQEQAESAIASATECGFPFQAAFGTMLHGAALVEQGQGEKGLAQIRQGLTAYWGTGARLAQTYWLARLIEVCGRVGQVEEAFTVLTESLELVAATAEHFYEAELYRLKGELLLRVGEWEKGRMGEKIPHSPTPPFAHSSPEACFHKAIEIARRQQAKALELRAVTSLARLWQQQGKPHEAHRMLSEIYGWFTEGFGTKDLQEAKALIEELVEGGR